MTSNSFQTVSNRILLVPSNKELGVQVIKRITQGSEGLDKDFVDWEISNKYYDAKVHFHRVPWKELGTHLEKGTPAIVVAWEKGEDHQYILGRYAAEWEQSNAEVKLAVAVGEGEIDTESVEEFCDEVGFEFVDVGDLDPYKEEEEEEEDEGFKKLDEEEEQSKEGMEGGGGMERLIEALHTVMWPSMKMKPQNRPGHRSHRSQASIERVSTSLNANNPSSTPSNQVREELKTEADMDKEKAKLEAWLNADDPWPSKPSTSTTGVADTASSHAFEDDFADFVSATSDPLPSNAGVMDDASKVNKEDATNEGKSQELHQEEEDEEVEFKVQDDEGDYKELLDDEMPSTEEILFTSQRIFGPMTARVSAEEGDEEDPGDFDLSSIMGALASMKEEIAGIDNEDEKRKMAARVALGLVWGLESR